MINKLPSISNPSDYAGLYIFDFGEHLSVGYTAEEIEYLLAEPQFRNGEAYRIYRAHSDGRLELKQVTKANWSLSTGIAFHFIGRKESESAFDELLNLSAKSPPPCNIEVSQASFKEQFVLIMQYISEYDDATANWLLKIKFQKGDHVEAGRGVIANILQTAEVLQKQTIKPSESRKSRPKEEVLENVDKSVQR